MASSGNPTWKESISLEETNKIRISLGLKPLKDEGPAKDEAADNFAKRREEQKQERESAALAARIEKARNTKERAKRLRGRGLGEADDDDEDKIKREDGIAGGLGDGSGADAKAWVKRQKKRAKELAAKREKELEEEERRVAEEGLSKYGEEDLRGLKVSHGADDFEEGEEHVLTLKDSRILDDEDDELHNLNMSENAKTAEAVALKKKGRTAGQYTGYDDDEFQGNPGSARGVLNKYNEEIMGKEQGGFRLGATDTGSKGKGAASKGKKQADQQEERERVKLSMDYAKTFNTDYLQEGEAGFKIKKKKKRATRQKDSEEQDEPANTGSMDVDAPSAPAALQHVNLDETNLVDDDDLQVSLAQQRREASKKKIAEMKKRAAEQATTRSAGGDDMDLDRVKAEPVDDEDDAGEAADGDDVLVLDDTSEFVRNIQIAAARQLPPSASTSATNGAKVKAEPGIASVAPVIKQEEVDEDTRNTVPLTELGGDDEPMPSANTRGGWGEPREEGEESDDDMAAGYQSVSRTEPSKAVKLEDEEIGGSSGQQLVSKGLASTLSLLRHQGLIVPRTPEELERDRIQREREAWLAAQRKRDRLREEERIASRAAGSSKDQAQREYENKMREQRDAQITMEAFKEYKPNVNLTYHDEFGRDMTPKEAWKHLSHAFHGKNSGSKKMEKRLAKVAAEAKARAMASGDTPLNTAAAFAARAERTGQATMILSVGNKGSAPVQEETLGLHKGSSKKDAKGKGKATANGRTNGAGAGRETSASASSSTVFNDIPMRPLPLDAAGGTGPAGDGRDRSGSPAVPRSGFAPVRGFAPATADDSSTANGRSASPSVEKLAIPLQVKRKAVGEATGAPAKKK